MTNKSVHALTCKYKLLKFNKFWMSVGCLLVLATVVVCLIPNPPSASSLSYGDKITHMAGYFCLFLWFAQIYERKNHYRPALGLILLGIAIEFAQSFTGYRSFEIADMLANTSGVLIGWVVAGSFVSFTFLKLESFVKKQSA